MQIKGIEVPSQLETYVKQLQELSLRGAIVAIVSRNNSHGIGKYMRSRFKK